MSNYEQKNGTGTIWKNEKYVPGGNQPYAKGVIKDLNGNDVDVALWIPKSDKIKGFNMTMKLVQKQGAQTNHSANINDNDIPF